MSHEESLSCGSWRAWDPINHLLRSGGRCIVLLGPTFWPLRLSFFYRWDFGPQLSCERQGHTEFKDTPCETIVDIVKLLMTLCWGAALYRTLLSEGWRAIYMRGCAPLIALKSGRLTRLCPEKSQKQENTAKRCPNFLECANLKGK